MNCYRIFSRACLFFMLIYKPSLTRGQDTLKCSDVRNGTFYYFGQKSVGLETFIRKGALQRELIPKAKETVLWDVEWLNDCTYSLKYESGAENHPAAEQKFLNKHLLITEILQVTEDYMTFRSCIDKVTNPTVLKDTLWIRQRQSSASKTTTNPRADSILASRKRVIDSTQASYATLYVYRPGKLLDFAVTYDLLINGEKACLISNGCRYILKLQKPGIYNITAKVPGPDQTVMIDVKPGGVYYVQCTCTWGLKSHKEVQLMDIKDGAAAFNSSEKAN
jgi:hypothetical protein